jgi:phage baseplate assembly protein W
MAEISFKSVGEAQSVSQNAQNRVEPNPIGLVTPMRLSKTQKDIFEMQYDVQDQIDDNLRNLILTNHGERLGMQDFGANIRPLIFSLSGGNFEKEVMTRIKSAAIKFLPFIELETFEISYDNRDTKKGFATIGMLISYGVPAIGVSGKRMQVVITAGG